MATGTTSEQASRLPWTASAPPTYQLTATASVKGPELGAEPAAGHSRSAVPPAPPCCWGCGVHGPGARRSGRWPGAADSGRRGLSSGRGQALGPELQRGSLGPGRHQSAVWAGHPRLASPRHCPCQLSLPAPRSLVSGGAGRLLQARWPSSPHPHPQRTSWSPTRTPRPSFCRARASRWTWRGTVWTPAPPSTSSTCATSCGACGASPALAGGPPHPRALRYAGLPSVALVLTTGWTQGLAGGPGPSHQGRSLMPELSLSSRARAPPPLTGTPRARAAPCLPGTQAGEPARPAWCILCPWRGLPGHRALQEGAAGAPSPALCTRTPPACSRLPGPRSSPPPPTGPPLAAPAGRRSWAGGGVDLVAPGGQLQKVRPVPRPHPHPGSQALLAHSTHRVLVAHASWAFSTFSWRPAALGATKAQADGEGQGRTGTARGGQGGPGCRAAGPHSLLGT